MDTKWKKRIGKAGFLCFVLGLSLMLGSVLNVGRIWIRDGYSPEELWEILTGNPEEDYQESEEFRDYICDKLEDFLIIGSGGDVYGGRNNVIYYYQPAGTYSITKVEVGKWQGDGTVYEESIPAFILEPESGTGQYEWLYWDDWKDYLDSGDYSGEEYWDLFVRRKELETEWKENARDYLELMEGDGNFLYRILDQGEELYSNAAKFGMKKDGTFPEEYNFVLHFDGSRVEILKDGENLDIYGDGYYRGDGCWFVPGYRNFSVGEKYRDIDVYMAAIREPVLYTDGGYDSRGYQQLDNSLYWMYQRNAERSAVLSHVIPVLSWILRAGLLFLALGLALRWGRREIWQGAGSVTGKIWVEWKALILLGAGLAFALSCAYSYNGPAKQGGNFGEMECSLLVGLTGVLLFWVLCLAGNDLRWQGRNVWRHGFTARLFRLMSVREQKLPLTKRMVRRGRTLFLVILGLWIAAEACLWVILLRYGYQDGSLTVAAVVLGAGFVIALALSLVSLKSSKRIGRGLEALTERIGRIRRGDYETGGIPERDGGPAAPEYRELTRAMEELEEIRQGIAEAIEEQMKSERMKVELIANVSHDLKTPLTSIISYVQFLKQEENLPDYVRDYVKILDEKSQRLNNMVQDIFMVSKAASGELPVNLEELDFAKLLRQTLADMEEEISASGLALKVNLPQEPVMIRADGQRLYRVFQNLIQNALKYSLEGSRIHVTLEQEKDLAVASVKNISRVELSEEIHYAERFVRGDASRTDGGSGLGLSIAQSFTEACGGQFELSTNADLFVVKVKFSTF